MPQSALRAALGALLLGSVTVGPANGDAPPASGPEEFCSLSSAVCAIPDVEHDVTRIVGKKRAAKIVAWTVPVVVRVGMVADDGLSLVQLPDSANLLPLSVQPEATVLTFWSPHAAPVRVSLRKLIGDMRHLIRTASHLAWAKSYGYERSGAFVLTTTEDVVFRFDPRTGKPTNRSFFPARTPSP